MKKICLFAFVTLILIQITFAATYPTIQPYVNDFGNFLTSEQISSLNSRCKQIEQNTTYEIAIVTLTTTNGADRLDYANHIGEQNGVGKKESDNGLVLLWTQDNEQGLAIAVGRGAESIFNDAKVSRIARDARPLFDDGKYYEGFNKMLNDLEAELHTTSTGEVTSTETDDITTWIIGIAVVIFIIFIILKIIGANTGDALEGSVLGGIVSSNEIEDFDDAEEARDNDWRRIGSRWVCGDCFDDVQDEEESSYDDDDDEDDDERSGFGFGGGFSFGGGSFGGGGGKA